MKKMRVLGLVIFSVLLVVSCKSPSDSSSKDVSSNSTTESLVISNETEKESSAVPHDADESESKLTEESSELTSSQEETTTDGEIPGTKESTINTPTAQAFYSKLSGWNIPIEYYYQDDSTSMDSYLCENGEVLEFTYIHYVKPEKAEGQFMLALKEHEIYDIVEEEIEETESEPRKYVARGHFQFDETSPILPDFYVFIQFEQEYIYLYGRGETQIQRVKELVKVLDIELPL